MTYTDLRTRLAAAKDLVHDDDTRRLYATARYCLFGMPHRTDFKGAAEALDLLEAIR